MVASAICGESMDGTQEVGVLVPTQDERTMATLAQVLQLVGGWIAPLIILIVKRDSKFVSFHALQALILQIIHLIVWIFFMMIFFVTIFATVIHGANTHNAPPTALFFVFPFFWLGAMCMWIVLYGDGHPVRHQSRQGE
jgi:uncharacterized membrane protein